MTPITTDRAVEDVDSPSSVESRRPRDTLDPGEDGCASCGRPSSEHGIHLLHRFVRPGQPVPTP